MINLLHKFRVFTYPHVLLKDVHCLPHTSGLYYCRQGMNILYIGYSGNLYHRWNSVLYGEHHKYNELLEYDERGDHVRIHYRPMPKYKIGFEEAVEIRRFKPCLNKRMESRFANLNPYVVRDLLVFWVSFLTFMSIGIGSTVWIGLHWFDSEPPVKDESIEL